VHRDFLFGSETAAIIRLLETPSVVQGSFEKRTISGHFLGRFVAFTVEEAGQYTNSRFVIQLACRLPFIFSAAPQRGFFWSPWNAPTKITTLTTITTPNPCLDQ
jgi:hypothetical protein